MIALVTGAAGFIGSHLVDGLLARGHHVVGLDRRSPTSDGTTASNLREALSHPHFTWHTTDLSVADLDELVDSCDVVFHLAAMAGVRSSWGEEFSAYLTHNVLATHRLIAACHRAGVRRLVLASSSSVYGDVRAPSAEDMPAAPRSPYGATKLAAEHLCAMHAGRFGKSVTTVALRYFSVYGPRQRPDMVIRRILTAALNGGSVDLYGDGTQRRDFTYVADVVKATVAAADLDVQHATVNVGGGIGIRLLDVLSLAGDVTGSPIRVRQVGEQAGDVHTTAADLTLARLLLGYRPQIGLREGITAEWEWLTSSTKAGQELRVP